VDGLVGSVEDGTSPRQGGLLLGREVLLPYLIREASKS
jgi:hypothetical protein